MKTILFGAALITLLTMSANAGEYSPVWYNYEEVDVGENPNWEELIYIENDTLWVASIDSISYPIQSGKSAEITDADLGPRERLTRSMMAHMKGIQDNEVRAEKAKEFLQSSPNATELITGEIKIIGPGLLLVPWIKRGYQKLTVTYYEPQNTYDPRKVLDTEREHHIQHLQRGGWLILRKGCIRHIAPAHVPSAIAQIRLILDGASLEELNFKEETALGIGFARKLIEKTAGQEE